MDGIFWTSYGVLAGVALGFIGTAIGLLIARDRASARNPTHRSRAMPPFPPLNRR